MSTPIRLATLHRKNCCIITDMRKVGKRHIREISVRASGELLKQGALFNDEIHRLPTGTTTFFPKGIYRYQTFEEANEHWDASLIEGMVRNARK